MIPAAIPFFELHVLNLNIPGIGALPIDPWATLVMIGFVVALEMGRARAIRLGLDVRDFVDGTVFTVVCGFVFAHIYTVIFYFPERLATDGIWSLLRIWQGFASTGGLIGAVIGANVFFRWIRPGPLGRYFDVITWCFPFGWLFGRMGCASVHDHIGKKTTFFLGMNFPPDHYAAGVRHELGLYEALYMVPVCALFLYLGRKDRPPGFFVGWFATLYCPIRFVLDFLRNDDLSYQDARYYGLTPAQYGMVVLWIGAIVYLRFRDNRGFVPVPLGRDRLVAPEPPAPAPEEP